MTDKKLYLLDAFALIYRAHFAFIRNPRYNSKGMNTSAVLGFTNSLLEIINNEHPTHIAVVFDSPGVGIREDVYSDYKANREQMPEDIQIAIPYIKRLIEAMNIPAIALEGYEADDIMGTLAFEAEKRGFVTYLMTPDKDFAQLVTENIFIYKPGRSGSPSQILGPKEICEKFEITNPKQVIDILGLWGDAVDNIPGIPGIGEKTAKKLIGEYGSVEALLENTEQLKGKQKENVETYAQQGLMSKHLATIILDCPVEFNESLLKKKKADETAILDLMSELEFNQLAKRILGEKTELKASPKSGQMSLFGQIEEEEELEIVEYKTINDLKTNYVLIEKLNEHKEFAKLLVQQQKVCFDTETSSLDTQSSTLLGIAFSFKKGEGYYCSIPNDTKKAKLILDLYTSFFNSESILKIAHNIKFDAAILSNYNIEINEPFFDTMIAHYLIEPDQRHSMDLLAKNYLSYNPISIETLIGKKGKNQKSMMDLPAELIKDYAAEDADVTFQLYEILNTQLKSANILELFNDIELPLSLVLMKMEKEGIKLNTSSLSEFSGTLNKSISALKKSIISEAGVEFNLDSPKQLGNILFEKMDLDEKAKKTKTGQYKTDEQTLLKLSHHEIIKNLLNYRQQKKLQSTYVEALPKLISTKTERIHTTFMQTITATGRLSSNHPNLQNIPIRSAMGKEIRRSFIPRSKDYLLMAADYSQIELRIIASMSNDKNMIEAFHRKEDIHSATASKVFQVGIDKVTEDMRRKAKMVNFGIIYGITPFGLSQRLNIKRSESNEIINSYFKEYPDIKIYMDHMIQFAKENGYVETIKKRRRYLKDINSRNASVRGFAERNAINAPIQGSAADIIKIAMINILHKMESNNLKSKLILQVHDELVFDLHNKEKDVMEKLVNNEMSNAVQLSVPLEVEIGIADNWLDAH